SHVDPWPREYHPALARVAQERTRSIEIGGTRSRAQQLSLLQRLHAGMPVERESRVAQSGNALRALETRRPPIARTFLQQRRFVGPNRLHRSLACECDARFCAG